MPRADGAESVHTMPNLQLSEEAFPAGAEAAAVEDEAPELDTVDAGGRDRVVAEAAIEAEPPRSRAEAESEPEAAAEPEDEQPQASRRRGRAGGRGSRAGVAEAAEVADEPAADESDAAEPAPDDETA